MKNLKPVLVLAIIILLGVSCTNKPSDRFVELEGKAQHILDMGRGEPVAVFVSGLGDDLTTFSMIQDEIAKTTRTLSYDRAGLGQSEKLNNARTVDNMAVELHEILAKEQIPKPFILIGHSIGGLIIRQFVNMYPKQAAAILLIDPAHQEMDDRYYEARNEKERREMDSMYVVLDTDTSMWPPGAHAEWLGWKEDKKLMKNVNLPSDIPITLLTSTLSRETQMLEKEKVIWVALHKSLLLDSPQINHILTDNSGHYIQKDEPGLVIAEIEELIRLVRSNKVSFDR